MYCNIANFTDIVKVDFYEVTDVFFSLPFPIYSPEIFLTDSPDNLTSKQKAGGYCKLNAAPKHSALIDEMSGEMSVDSQTSVAGIKYRCSLSYNVEYNNTPFVQEEYKMQLVDLQKRNFIVVLTYISGDRQVIRTDKDGWKFEFKENKGTVTVTLTMENISGAQRVLTE